MSRVPLEQMMASLRPLSSVSNCGTIAGAVSVVVMRSLRIEWLMLRLDAAVRFGQSRDVGHLLGGLAGEELEQFLHRYSTRGRDAADGRCFALDRVVVAQEVDRLPVRFGEGDSDLGGENTAELLVPF